MFCTNEFSREFALGPQGLFGLVPAWQTVEVWTFFIFCKSWFHGFQDLSCHFCALVVCLVLATWFVVLFAPHWFNSKRDNSGVWWYWCNARGDFSISFGLFSFCTSYTVHAPMFVWFLFGFCLKCVVVLGYEYYYQYEYFDYYLISDTNVSVNNYFLALFSLLVSLSIMLLSVVLF